MVDDWRPPIPPPVNPETNPLVTRFEGWVVGYVSTPKNYDKFTIAVPRSEVFQAMLMMENPLMLSFEVRTSTPIDPDDLTIDAELLAILQTPEPTIPEDTEAFDEGAIDWNELDG